MNHKIWNILCLALVTLGVIGICFNIVEATSLFFVAYIINLKVRMKSRQDKEGLL